MGIGNYHVFALLTNALIFLKSHLKQYGNFLPFNFTVEIREVKRYIRGRT